VRSKAIGILALLALTASIGVAMAMWTETLKVNVGINTGEVKLDFDAWCVEHPEVEGKDVGSCTADVTTDEDGNPLVVVNISNAYPWYGFTLYVRMNNTGTVPVKIYNYTYSISGDDLTSWLNCTTNATQVQIDPYDVNPDEQVKTFYFNCTFIQDNEDGEVLPENAQMTILGQVVFAQWNEVTGDLQGPGPQ